jgi:SAM-dependent methyltransferase
LCDGYTRENFLTSLKKRKLWEMDALNRFVGTTEKFWWERHLPKITGKRILEVGCGLNYLVPYWLESGNEVVAVDISTASVMLLGKFIDQTVPNHPRLDLIAADATQLHFNAPFDIVNVCNVLHHIDDKKTALRRIADCLSPGGKLIVVEPNYCYPPRWLIQSDALGPLNPLRKTFVRKHVQEAGEKAIIPHHLKSLMKEAGLSIDVCEADPNHLGYGSVFWLTEGGLLPKLIGITDNAILRHVIPDCLSPFVRIIAVKK